MPKALRTSFVSAVLVAACGGGAPPPPPAPPAVAEPQDAAPQEVPEATPTPADAGAEAAPAAAASPETTIVSGDPEDECTPVAADFEKRARPKLKECYREGKKKEPNLQGKVVLKLTIDLKGKIKSTKVIEKTLPDPVATCMLKVVKETPFPEVEKCWDRTIKIPMVFPTP